MLTPTVICAVKTSTAPIDLRLTISDLRFMFDSKNFLTNSKFTKQSNEKVSIQLINRLQYNHFKNSFINAI